MAIIKEEKVKNLLERNVQEVIEKDHLEKMLLSGRKLRVKLGIDPTSPDLHLGHAVVLWKLKEFQDSGHKIILIIGDFTGRIGDPSGKSETRKPLTEKEIRTNMKAYLKQAGKVINVGKTEIFYNSSWFLKEGIEKMIQLTSASSIQQVLRRADFKKRLEEEGDITLLELLYPLFQGYDSVKVKADVELGGTDQTFNLLMGRRVQRHFGMKEQDVMTVPLLEGLDGVKKMSKSLGNYIGLYESAQEMFGKIMSLPDDLVIKYFRLGTFLEESEISSLKKGLSPRNLKARLGFEIAKIYQGEKRAREAEDNFTKTFSKKDLSEVELPIWKVKRAELSLMDLLMSPQDAKRPSLKSKIGWQRLVEGGAIRINNEVKKNRWEAVKVKDGDVLKLGKKDFLELRLVD